MFLKQLRATVIHLDKKLGGFLYSFLCNLRLKRWRKKLPYRYEVMRITPSQGELALGLVTRDSDKAGADQSVGSHMYHEYYQTIFEQLRLTYESVRVLEFGVAEGASILAFSDYFDSGVITGVDIESPTSATVLKEMKAKKVDFYKRNMYKPSDIETLFRNDLRANLQHLIIDDGPHDYTSTEICLRHGIEFLSRPGWYIIEDLRFRYLDEYILLADELCRQWDRTWELVVFDQPSWRYPRGEGNSLLVIR